MLRITKTILSFRSMAVLLFGLTIPHPGWSQPPAFTIPEEVVTRYLEASRNANYEEMGECLVGGLPENLPLPFTPETVAFLEEMSLILSREPEVKSTFGQPEVKGDEAIAPVRREIDLSLQFALRKVGDQWKIDFDDSRPFWQEPPLRPEQGPVVALKRLGQLPGVIDLRDTLPFWCKKTLNDFGLDQGIDDNDVKEWARALHRLWLVYATPETKFEIGKAKVEGDRARVSVRKRFVKDQRVVMRQEEGVWRIDLLKTVGLSSAGGREFVEGAQQKRHLGTCMSNLQQISLAAAMYIQDWEGLFPPAEKWVKELMPYLKNEMFFRCPAANPKVGYAMRGGLSKAKMASVPLLAETVLFFESDAGGENPHDDGKSLPAQGRHMGGVALAYLDGHVKWHTTAEARELLAKPLDLKLQPEPNPAENAFDAYVAAGELLKANGGASAAYGKAADEAEQLAVVERNQGTLRLLREGFNRPYQPRPIEGPAQLFPELSLFRDLTRLLAVEARVLVQQGIPGAAIEAAIDGLRFAHDIPIGGGALHRLVSQAMEEISINALEPIIPQLTVQDATQASLRLAELDRTELLVSETLKGERAFTRRALDQLMTNPDVTKGWAKEFKGAVPLFPKTATTLESYYDELLLQADKPFYQRKELVVPRDPLLAVLTPSCDRLLAKVAESRARRRLALTALALQAYRREHDGYPGSRDALSPAILAAIPADPFHDGPLFYRREGEGFLLYSAGPDCDDDGGKPLPREHGPKDDGDVMWVGRSSGENR